MIAVPNTGSLHIHTSRYSQYSQIMLLGKASIHRLIHLPGWRLALLSQPGGCSKVPSHCSVAELSYSSDVWGQHHFWMLHKEVMRIDWFLSHRLQMSVTLLMRNCKPVHRGRATRAAPATARPTPSQL